MDSTSNESKVVRIEFAGAPFSLLGRIILQTILWYLIIPAPWVTAWFWRWFVAQLKLSDQTQVTFKGKGSEIWFVAMALAAISVAGYFFPFLLALLLLPVSSYFGLVIMRWFYRSLSPSCGTQVSFEGGYLPLLGWNVLLLLSYVTIIGWAWVLAGMIRWICRNVRGGQYHVKFQGNGWSILWRTLVFCLSGVLIVPIPWMLQWLVRWLVGSFTIERASE